MSNAVVIWSPPEVTSKRWCLMPSHPSFAWLRETARVHAAPPLGDGSVTEKAFVSHGDLRPGLTASCWLLQSENHSSAAQGRVE